MKCNTGSIQGRKRVWEQSKEGEVYHHDNRLRMPELMPTRIRMSGQSPALLAAWSGTLTIADTEEVLRDGGGVAGLGVEPTGGGFDVAVAAVALVIAAVFGDGGFVGLGEGEKGKCEEEEGRGTEGDVHDWGLDRGGLNCGIWERWELRVLMRGCLKSDG